MRTIHEYEEQSIGIIQEAAEEHGEGLHALISYGSESALLSHILKISDVPVKRITIDSGFRLPGTDSFQERLSNRDGFEPIVCGPTDEEVEAVKAEKLWKTNLRLYHEITRQGPLRQAIGELGITALLSGVRHGQTAHRATLNPVEPGVADEVRIYPLLHWSEEQAENYFSQHNLLRPPLHYQGYGSSGGDWTTTTPGQGREGRKLPNSECGLHVMADGELVRAAA